MFSLLVGFLLSSLTFLSFLVSATFHVIPCLSVKAFSYVCLAACVLYTYVHSAWLGMVLVSPCLEKSHMRIAGTHASRSERSWTCSHGVGVSAREPQAAGVAKKISGPRGVSPHGPTSY